MRRPRREEFGRDQFFPRPDAGKWVQAVGERLAEHDDVRRDAEVLDGPELSRAIEAHLDFVIDNQDLVFAASLLQALKVVARRNHVAARSLHRFDVKCAVFRRLCFGIPDAIVFIGKKLIELIVAI